MSDDRQEQWKQVLREKRRIVHAALRTPNGKKLLQMLEDTFQNRKLYNDNVNQMIRQVSHYDLVQYLKELMETPDDE